MRVICDYFNDSSLKVDLLCFPLAEERQSSEAFNSINQALKGQLKELFKGGHFSGKFGEMLMLIPHPGQRFKRLLLVGMGNPKELALDRIRKVAGITGQKSTDKAVATVGFIMPELPKKDFPAEEAAQAIVEGINLGSYFIDRFRSEEKKMTRLTSLTLVMPKKTNLTRARSGARLGLTLSDLQNHCRDLAFSPANVITPQYLAVEARKLARKHRLRIQVYGKSQIEKFGMGAFLAVAKGSTEPPQLIRIDYSPKSKNAKKIVLIGKGITFDTGGITLKPGTDMHEMKQDMSGAAAVLCTMAALTQIKPQVRVTAFIPTCENMPGSRAYRPGDVLTTSIGKTIEVISTDAEGRLLLADVLGHASKMKPDYMIDVATLTGAVIIALGHAGAAMLSTSEKLLETFRAASEATGEKIWQLPLWDDYEHQLKSPIADMKNSFGRPAGTITAALMLKKFTNDIPWLHLDIAGMDLEYRGTEYTPKGASGFGMRLMTEVIRRL